ncbi:unnamed protein product [Bursaphelenchus okinawaensis]|uniref:GST C-terminal domain-containing protein n=1 Tax=Bursaphelenchus okinawaensis TaxID=465554 RepID=A0A811KLF7_9BILA|nr:unnamed protein product [Bursaphelenchus okinawaensis]CAG9106209.1 unnamed protein product [Bursaphelenchus okinawaensis]
MSLYVYPSFVGLPSMDSKCLQFLAAAKFCAAEITVHTTTVPFNSPTGTLPGFVTEDGVQITEFEDFVTYLRSQHQAIQLDFELDNEQKSQFDSYKALLNIQFVPTLENVFFLDEFNYSALMINWYSNYVTFPMNIYYLNKRKNLATKIVNSSGRSNTNLLTDGINVLNMLSSKLGESKYFFGTKPSSFDALIYGYLAPLHKLPLANTDLQLHLSALPNLTLFVETITSIYLPLSIDQISYQLQQQTKWMAYTDKERKRLQNQRAAQQLRKLEREKAEKTTNNKVILFAVVSLTASLLFALHTGIIRVQSEQKHTIRKKR